MSSNSEKNILSQKTGKTIKNDETSSSSSYPPLPYSPLPITPNRFAPLSSFTPRTLSPFSPRTISPRPRAPYSVLAQLQNIPKTPSIPNISKTVQKNPEYHINPNRQVIDILEPSDETQLEIGFHSLLEHLYPKNHHFYNNDYQTREYYQAILVDSKSIIIDHNYNSKVPTYIDCSKVKIINIISPEEWSIKLYSHKTLSRFPTYPVYNYYDYKEAWFKAFLLRSFNHTWFFYFADKFTSNYPRWFVKWFRYMGSIPEIFPPKVLQGFNKYKQLFAQDNTPLFEYTLQFSIVFRIPWIVLFTYKKQEAQDLSPPLLYRQYSVKWWKKIEEDQAAEKEVIRYHQSLTKQNIIGKSTTSKALPDTDYITRLNSCSTPEEMQLIINEIKKSPTPSEDLLQDAQDPYDCIDLN